MKKLILLRKDTPIDYQTVIEEVFGDYIATLDCYCRGDQLPEQFANHRNCTDKHRDYFIPKADYELIIVKKRHKKGEQP